MADEFKDFRVPSSSCPRCGCEMDGALGSKPNSDAPPRAGSLAVCIDCGAPLVFAEDLSLRLLSDQEILALRPEERADLVRVVAAVQLAQLSRPEVPNA